MKTLRHAAMIVLSAAVAADAGGAEWHVAPLNALADDGNPGTAERPFRTVTAALGKA